MLEWLTITELSLDQVVKILQLVAVLVVLVKQFIVDRNVGTLKHEMNSMKDALVETTRHAAHLEGRAEVVAEQLAKDDTT